MMLEPSIDELLTKVRSKYSLVILSAKRARQLRKMNNLLIEHPKSLKNVGRALEEVNAGKIVLENNQTLAK
ncbi:DNA-directed RNA polymerase subunit omega [Virgibacillus sp. 179-BFC.A HS]|uniref:DNA-directed RNA polymerase subunit omega n=1 Tax=Tigheibacillus jepli TaxID=3035914 RepID=A0ABU5CI08_9BACI|nr:DNA-directed RNA polymerase subunit omega [Virgibacillus sp. 179-BFC.A HS]MDY0405931.1 DNA-directed RNA polymerase subunit omega [Virgibacillus sp. 179-BFC.A HS]